MKLTPNERNICGIKALSLYAMAGHLTWKEAHFYSYLRDHAFYSETKKKRNLCRINASHLSGELGMDKNNAYKLLKNLEKAKLIQPYYYIKKGNELIEVTDIKGVFVGNIHHTKYKVKNVPGEGELRKTLLAKKKLRAKNKPEN